jgi:ribulose-phosphate 3-epimerase
MPKVAASILSADFSRLRAEVERVESAGVDIIHLDVMDGRFVEVVTFDYRLVGKVNAWTTLPLDVHLMVEEPLDWVEPMVNAGADYLTIHYEADRDPRDLLAEVRRRGARSGLAINPGTPFDVLTPFLSEIDLLLLMSVEPGYAGQSFDERVMAKIARAREQIRSLGLSVEIEVDGGVKPALAGRLIDAGVDILVAATAIFQADDMRRAVASLRGEKG